MAISFVLRLGFRGRALLPGLLVLVSSNAGAWVFDEEFRKAKMEEFKESKAGAASPSSSWRRFSFKSFLLACFAVLLLGALLWPSQGGMRERFRRSACASNMTKIGMALAHYATDNKGFLPGGDVFAAMTALRKLDYLSLELLRSLSLTNPRPGAEDIPLTPEMLPYLYFGEGLNLGTAPKETMLLCDRPDRHKQFGHVLFADGHLEGFQGRDWFKEHVRPPEKAGPPKGP